MANFQMKGLAPPKDILTTFSKVTTMKEMRVYTYNFVQNGLDYDKKHFAIIEKERTARAGARTLDR